MEFHHEPTQHGSGQRISTRVVATAHTSTTFLRVRCSLPGAAWKTSVLRRRRAVFEQDTLSWVSWRRNSGHEFTPDSLAMSVFAGHEQECSSLATWKIWRKNMWKPGSCCKIHGSEASLWWGNLFPELMATVMLWVSCGVLLSQPCPAVAFAIRFFLAEFLPPGGVCDRYHGDSL